MFIVNEMKRIGLFSMVMVLWLLVSIDGYAWGKRSPKAKTTHAETKKEDRYEELLQKAKSDTGMLTIHRIENDWYFEIPDDLMGRDLLVVNKVSGVPYELNDAGLNKGMVYEEKLIRFQKDTVFQKVWVTTWNPRVSVPKEDAIARSVKDNYRETVIEQFPIETFNKDS